jgi:hypothetical protein
MSLCCSRGCVKSQNASRSIHPEFILGYDLQCVWILKQVQDDGINDFLDNPNLSCYMGFRDTRPCISIN